MMTIGIDEVGRGPVAGPVCVCAFTFKSLHRQGLYNLCIGLAYANKLPLRDSKKLTREQREKWFTILKLWQKEGKCDFTISYVSAKTIDRIGIAPSISNAISHSLSKLLKKSTILQIDGRQSIVSVLLDGGLKAPKEFKNQKTIIKGDEKEIPIMFASIVAKVSRDRLMERLSRKFPKYGFENHVGYGTKAHYKAIKKHGLTKIHRKSFLRKLNK